MNLRPSITTGQVWIYTEAPGESFESSDVSGKWCILSTPDAVDGAWLTVAALVAKGVLLAAKVSTHLAVASGGYEQHVICVYTRDWRDEKEALRARHVLRGVGFDERMGYKRDSDTQAGVERTVYEA